ncbi:MAG: hypothetical protein C0523_00400, partial [Cytophaga sp.]|nr:hypothetical protein [Cytophaga sp.]
MNVEDRHYTNALSYTWPDLEAWVACNLNALQEEFISEHNLGLTDLQRADRLRILRKLYHHFEIDLNNAKSWGDIVNLLQSALEFKCLNPSGNLRYHENIHFFEPSFDSSVGLSIKAHVLSSIGSITQMISYNLQRTILDTGYFYPEDAFVLSNENIKSIIQRTINDQSPLTQI